jgi:signal transduction histidine kinase
VLAAGGAYVLAYWLVVGLLPAPATEARRVAIAAAFLLVPTGIALAACLRAAGASRGADRAFWSLLAGSAAAQAVNVLLYSFHRIVLPHVEELKQAAHLAYHTYIVLVCVALQARPDRPRGQREVRTGALEWLMGAIVASFLVLYFVVLPAGDRGYPWIFIYTAQLSVPMVWALVLGLRVRDEPFRRVYQTLAAGFVGSACFGLLRHWLGIDDLYRWVDVGWVIPFVFMTAAASSPRGPVWMRSYVSSEADRRRARLIAVAVAFPPLLDLAMRGLWLQPYLADARTALALYTAALLSVLVAVRLHRARQQPVDTSPADLPDARSALGEPSEFLQLASGAAHELNNPLMAVAGWAELALRRGGPEKPLNELLAATRTAADAVARLQKLARSGRGQERP